MISRFGHYIPLAFLVTLLFICGNFVLTFKNIEILKAKVEESELTARTTNEIERTLIELTSAETSQRGYLLTYDEFFLKEYEKHKTSLNESLDLLNRLTSENQTEYELATRLQEVSKQRVQKLEEGRAIRDELGFDSAAEFIREGQGRDKMIKAKNLIDQLFEIEKNEAKVRQEELADIYYRLFLGIFIGSLISFGLVAISYYLIKRELDVRIQVEKGKDEFINMASHELKTPITSLKVYIQVVSKHIAEKNLSEANRYLSKIDEQTNKLTSLIVDLLDMSRIQTGKMKVEKEPMNIDVLIDDTVEALQGTTKKHQIIAKGDLQRMVSADRYRIYQVLVNLLTNAIKYSPKGGKIIVETKNMNGRAVISVKDEGMGIDRKYQKKIFERLYQVTDRKEKTFPGLGIGLYISNEIVKRHGGKMWVESRKNKGSTFYFDLPFND